ncbi:hypothetical protein VTK26DRAFT_7515 [Humicola hyalothermophila]
MNCIPFHGTNSITDGCTGHIWSLALVMHRSTSRPRSLLLLGICMHDDDPFGEMIGVEPLESSGPFSGTENKSDKVRATVRRPAPCCLHSTQAWELMKHKGLPDRVYLLPGSSSLARRCTASSGISLWAVAIPSFFPGDSRAAQRAWCGLHIGIGRS